MTPSGINGFERSIIDDPSKVIGKSITQVVTMLADGKLTDKGQTAPAFRDFLNNCRIDQLETYINQMVTEASDGKIFQDIVNTIGKKIGFEVVHGLYHGKKNAIGFDGLWQHRDLNLVIECKTTDAYRISTKTLLSYSNELKAERGLQSAPPILLVVGRVDTGDIEAQIRGSRADDRISVIGVESLLSLAKAAVELSDGPAADSLRNILLPRDYTRLDDLTALITNVINEAQQTSQDQAEADEGAFTKAAKEKAESTGIDARSLTDKLRSSMVNSSEQSLGKLEKASPRSKAQFVTEGGQIYFFLASKRYSDTYQQFWYSIQNSWKEVWEQKGGGLVLGLEGKQYFFVVDYETVIKWTKFLNETLKPDRRYWHLALRETRDKIEVILSKSGDYYDIQTFKKKFIDK